MAVRRCRGLGCGRGVNSHLVHVADVGINRLTGHHLDYQHRYTPGRRRSHSPDVALRIVVASTVRRGLLALSVGCDPIARIQLVCAKATEGIHGRDPMFATNWPAMRAARFPYRFAYHFATNDPPDQQAAWFAACVGKVEQGDGVMVDIEWVDTRHGNGELDPGLVAALLAEVKARMGRTPLRYMGEGYAGFNDSRLAPYPLWLACYRSARPPTPVTPVVWQWGGGTNGDFIAGIDQGKSRVDSNEVENWKQLASLVGAEGPAAV
jgi:hypothetical protein